MHTSRAHTRKLWIVQAVECFIYLAKCWVYECDAVDAFPMTVQRRNATIFKVAECVLKHCCRSKFWVDIPNKMCFMNTKKFYCLFVGHRFDSKFSPILTLSGDSRPCVNVIRYILRDYHSYFTYIFKCSLNCAKSAYYRSLNARPI